MAKRTRSQLISDIANLPNLVSSNGLVNVADLQTLFTNIVDSLPVADVYTMTTNEYNCNNSDIQVRALSGNGTLTILNAIAGRVYMLKKTGNFTLTLPTSEFSASGNTVPVGTAWITFVYDGTDYSFNYSIYTGT